MNPKDIKLEYNREELNVEDLFPDPMNQFGKWFKDAVEAEVTYANAATLSTLNEDGPDTRIILIKDYSEKGISFFTDYTSSKGLDIANNPKVGLLLFWKELDRQIRIQGIAKKVDPLESEEYFATRPRESQISAQASNQSEKITKEELYKRVETLTKNFDQKEVPCPINWGGYLISISKIEFWQGRPNRLHDRFLYEKDTNSNSWNISRLSP